MDKDSFLPRDVFSCPQPVSVALVSHAPVRSSLVQAGLAAAGAQRPLHAAALSRSVGSGAGEAAPFWSGVS